MTSATFLQGQALVRRVHAAKSSIYGQTAIPLALPKEVTLHI